MLDESMLGSRTPCSVGTSRMNAKEAGEVAQGLRQLLAGVVWEIWMKSKLLCYTCAGAIDLSQALSGWRFNLWEVPNNPG